MAFSDPEKRVEGDDRKRISVNSPESTTSFGSRRSSDDVQSSSIHSNEDEQERNLTPRISRNENIPLDRARSGVSVGTTGTQNPAFEVDWDGEDDPGNPLNWSLGYKSLVIGMISYTTMITVLYSTSYTSAIPGIMEEFDISQTIGLLGLTTYLLGMAVGCVICAPMSEMLGRRPVYLLSLGLFVILVLPTALAQNLTGILIPRFVGAVAAAAMVSNAPGSINDVAREEYRALVFSIWGIGPLNGPVLGPLIGGWVFQYAGWRWVNWVIMIASGVGFASLILVKESYAPAILRKKAQLRRKETGDERWWSRYDERKSLFELLKVNLSRPFIMLVTEPICIFWDIYIAVAYAILYLCFVAYPIVFSDYRGWSPGFSGLAFLGLGIGSLIVIVGEPLIRRIINRHKRDPETGRPPPEAQVSIICVGAILAPLGQIMFAWTCIQPVHWIWPIIAGVPFCMGTTTLFIYGNNYILHSYGIYAASALAGNAVLRSITGATLPLAGPAMYAKLGPHWAGTLLGFLELACVPIPIVFYRYGAKIRMKSALIRKMQEDQMRLAGRRIKAERRLEAEVRAQPAMETGAAIGEIEVEKDGGDSPVEQMDLEKGLQKEVKA